MQRHLMEKLLDWKKNPRRKPLILRGVRQCGKTWLLKEFARLYYDRIAYFNFESERSLSSIFSGDIDVASIISSLSVLCGEKIEPAKTLIVFDEIQECPTALNSLKYFCEQMPDYHVAAAGSLLGITLSSQTSFPVGKVNFLDLHPMSFLEFLSVMDISLAEYVSKISTLDQIPEAIANRLERQLRHYLIHGGMPEVVMCWKESKDFLQAEKVQKEILQAYELDFAKHAPQSDIPKLFLLWKSIPVQLARENGKFIYGEVKTGARARSLEDALRWLIEAGLVCKVNRIERPGVPLSAYVDAKYFKLYLADTGLLRHLAGVPASAILNEPDIFGEFKGRLAENYVLQQLRAIQECELFYWTSGNMAEVDFLMAYGQEMLPVEVKSGMNVKSRSLKVYRDKYRPPAALRLSLQNLKIDSGLLNVPLYLIDRIPYLLKLAIRDDNESY